MRRFTVVFAAALALTAGCDTGGDPDAATGTTTEPETDETSAVPPVELPGKVSAQGTATLTGEVLPLDVDDFFFEPTFVRVDDPGIEVTVRATNEGNVEHTFTLDEGTIDEILRPGQTEEFVFTAPESGHLRFYCRFHVEQGMQGAFFVP